MKIRFIKTDKRDFGPLWAKHIKVFVFDFWFFAVQVSFGKKPFDAWAYNEFLHKTFDKSCEVCHKPLTVTAVKQDIRYHAKCRKLRHKPHAQLA